MGIFLFGRSDKMKRISKDSSLLKTYLKFAFQSIIGMVSISIYILADTFFIAQALGEKGLAALNISLPIYNVVNSLAILIGVGGAIKFSILKAQKQDDQAKMYYSLAIKSVFVLAVLFVITGIFFTGPIVNLIGSDDYLFDYAYDYSRLLLIGAPAFMFNTLFQAFVRNEHKPRIAMVGMIASSLLNIVLDYILLFPLNMGMLGAAIATVFSTFVSVIIILTLRYHKEFSEFINLLKTKVSLSNLKTVIGLGLSPFISELISSIVLITYNILLIQTIGNIGVAAFGIIFNIAIVAMAIFSGLGHATQPLASHYYGKKDVSNTKRLLKYAIVIAMIISLVIYIVVNVNASFIISLFNRDDNLALYDISKMGLRLYFIGFFFFGLNSVLSTYFNAIEKVRFAFLITLIRGLILIVPIAIVLSRILGVNGVWMAFPIAELITLMIVFIVLLTKKKLDN